MSGEHLEAALTASERKRLASLSTPGHIQDFLDNLPYRAGDDYICPLSVLRRREAHCFDGAVFAAAALSRLGHPPKILYMIADKDDHHMLALFRRGRCWGAVSKSNVASLGFREPVYRSIRELVMSYFDLFFNIHGLKGLRSYVGPLSLRQFDRLRWMTSDAALEAISDRLDWMRIVPIVTRSQVRRLTTATRRVYNACFHDTDRKFLYRP